MTGRDRSLVTELEKRLIWYREEATEEEFDAEEVDAICVMLQKLSPVKETRMSREEAYRNIMRRVREEDGVEETDGAGEAGDADSLDGTKKTDGAKGTVREFEKEDGKKRYFFKRGGLQAAVLFIAVFGAAMLSLNMVTYAREDKSLFTMILERVGLVEIVKEERVEGSSVNGEETIEKFYNSWAELDSEIKSKIVVPKYIPSGFELYSVNYCDLRNRKRVKADYYNKRDGHLIISAILWEDNSERYKEMAMDEEGYTLIAGCSDKNVLYYEYEDEYICMLSLENSFYRISGNVTLEDMIKVREGLMEF